MSTHDAPMAPESTSLRETLQVHEQVKRADRWAEPWVTDYICGIWFHGGFAERNTATVFLVLSSAFFLHNLYTEQGSLALIAGAAICAFAWLRQVGVDRMNRAQRIWHDCRINGTCVLDHPEYLKLSKRNPRKK